MDKRIAVVTGANRGIGLEICRQLADAGLCVVLTSRDESKGKRARDALDTGAAEVRFHQLDVTDGGSVESLAQHLEAEYGRLDVLVNNACPGLVDTDMGRPEGRPVEEGADTVVWLALLPEDGPSGGLFRDREPVPW